MKRLITMAALLLLTVGSASAYTFSLDRFSLTKNGVRFFNDEFDNGIAPTDAPNFENGVSASYSVRTGTTVGPESGGKLTLDSSTATPSSSNPNVTKFHFTMLNGIYFDRNVKTVNTFSIEGLFDLGYPTVELNKKELFGIRTTDSGGNDQLRLSVSNDFSGNNFITFDRFGQDLNGVVSNEMIALESGHDQILLKLSKLSAASDLISASFSYVDSGVVGTEQFFNQRGLIFQGEEFTRAAFYAAEVVNPVPIPAAAWLFGSGLLGLFGYSKSRRSA